MSQLLEEAATAASHWYMRGTPTYHELTTVDAMLHLLATRPVEALRDDWQATNHFLRALERLDDVLPDRLRVRARALLETPVWRAHARIR